MKMKKMISILLGCALLMSVCGLGASAEGGIDEILAGMSLRDKVAQMMLISPRAWKDDPESEEAAVGVRELNDALRQYIADHRFGGILLFAENTGEAAQTLRLVADMQSANQQGGGLPMFIAIDQEGGTVARLAFSTRGTGAMALTATGDPESARAMGRVFGEDLRPLGINVDFAPDMDVNSNPANPVIGARSFGDDAGIVAEYGCAFMEGLHGAGTIATIKHFPGHGDTGVDSHTGLPLVDKTLDELRASELIPFKAAIDAGADMVMTAHIQFPRVEMQTYVSITTGEEVYIPATMSKVLLTDVLRGELGFEGVIASDSLEMSAIWDNYAIDDAVSMAINAGVNLLILPAIRDAGMLEQIDEILDHAVANAEAGVIDIDRIDDSVRRILTLKQKYGLLDQTDFTVTEDDVAAALKECGSAEHYQTAWNLAVKALTVLKNENEAFPLKLAENEKALILFSAASRVGSGAHAAMILEELGALPEGAQIESLVITPETAEECIAAAKAADRVLIVSRAWDALCLDPATEDGFPVGVINQVIDDLHADGKTAVVISAQLPYDAACFPEADAILLTYCSGPASSVPAPGGEGSAWVPNLPAAICAAFGVGEPGGVLPVNLPKLDEEYHLTDEILYARQIDAGQ